MSNRDAAMPQQKLVREMKLAGEESSDEDVSISEKTDKEEEDEEMQWTLQLEGNIYSSSLVMPLKKQERAHFFVTMLTSFTLLMLVLGLQIMVIVRVHKMTEKNKSEADDLVFAPKGSCYHRTYGEVPHKNLLEGAIPHDIYSCTPLTVTLMSNVTQLDSNGDGHWEWKEVDPVGWQWQRAYHKAVTLEVAFAYFKKQAMKGAMKAQWCGQVTPCPNGGTDEQKANWRKLTKNFTQFPMSWMQAEQGRIDLCAAVDPRLCGNLEARGILKRTLDYLHPSDDPDAPDSEVEATNARINACQHHLQHTCVDTFGQLYESYREYARQACGEPERSWNSKASLITLEYDMVETFTDPGNGIQTNSYIMFLLLIIMLWWMSLLQEFRMCVDWWIILLLSPTKPDSRGEYVVDKDDKYKVNAIPPWLKVFTILCSLGPRTIICGVLAVYGTDFLISSDDYGDLILNSVALGFLISIDEMLFAAVMSKDVQTDLENCEELVVEHSCFKTVSWFSDYQFGVISGIVLLVGISLYYRQASYTGKFGKWAMAKALKCFCDLAGPDCLAAQLMGGLPYVP